MKDADRQNLLSHFRDEAEDHIEAISTLLPTLGARPDDEAIVGALLRHAHSLKGASKLVGGTELERLTHALETVLVEVRAKRLPPIAELVDALIRSADAMRSALERLMAGTTDGGGSEDVVSRLLSMAASAAGLDQRLNAALPGLDPEILDVLTEFQKSQLVVARDAGKTCWEAELDAPEEQFTARIDQTYEALKNAGDVISLAGLSPLAEDRLRFKFVVATRQTESAVMTLAAGLSLIMTNPALPCETAPVQVALSEDEAAFAEEMAKLVAQYVTEAADEVDEAAKLILALEANPADTTTLNTLFRTAHSLKGSGMTYGMAAVSEVAHHMETVLEAVRDRRVVASTRVTNALLTAADALKDLFARARSGQSTVTAPADVLRLLHDVATNAAPADVAAADSRPVPAAAPRTHAPASETIRVRLDKLDRLVNIAGELTIVRNSWEAAGQGSETHAGGALSLRRQWQALRDRLQRDARVREHLRDLGWLDEYEQFGTRLAVFGTELDAAWNRQVAANSVAQATTAALQDAVMSIRMVPVASLFNTAPRMLRDLTSDGKKAVELKITGEDTELDKRLLEMMTDPLMHLLRNAADHGIETIEERSEAGKPPTGVIQLSAEHRGGQIVITVKDDGRGMDPERLVAAAVTKGLIAATDADRVTTEQAYALIFSPGFSTKQAVTSISGRGVGMDVVKSNIDALKGRIEIDSAPGIGTTFRLHLPLSLSVIQVILVECGAWSFCLPSIGIAEITRIADMQGADGKATVQYRDKEVPIVRLSDLLGFEHHRPLGSSEIVMVSSIEGTVGFVIDRAVAEETVLVKPIGKFLKQVPHVSGGTILSDGRVAVILDMQSLLVAALRHGGTWVDIQPLETALVARKRLLVVDDSLTTRELIRGLLESAGYDVITARHGREAWELLQSTRKPDLVVSDVSMPEMDGYQLTSKIKGDARLSRVPVVLVTSLSKPEEERRGMAAGADAYIVKGAFNQTGLLARVEELTAHG